MPAATVCASAIAVFGIPAPAMSSQGVLRRYRMKIDASTANDDFMISSFLRKE